jgi:excisionase family DNA binding protein
MALDDSPFLDVEQVAARLGTTERFVRRLIDERRITFHHFGKYVRIRETDLAAFIAAGRVEANSTPIGRRAA